MTRWCYGREEGADGGRIDEGEGRYWRIQDHADARAGEAEDGDHVAFLAFSSSPGPGIMSRRYRAMRPTYLTRLERERRVRVRVGKVVIMVAWHGMFLRFGSKFLVSEGKASRGEVLVAGLARLAWC
jgi:hypothetical protein